MGADDYMPKPFNPRELVARIRAILRRMEPVPEDERKQLALGPFLVDLEGRSITCKDGTEIELTGAEFDLLVCFVTRPKRVLSRDQLMDWTRGRQANAGMSWSIRRKEFWQTVSRLDLKSPGAASLAVSESPRTTTKGRSLSWQV